MGKNASFRGKWGIAARAVAMVGAFGLVLVGVSASPALADTSPPAGTPATVSTDALPTWQINGVVWSQAIVGNTVYVAGNFTKARPPGVAIGGAGELAASYAFAYDITTGNRVASFAPQFNAQTNFVTASADGKRVYFGGDFTTVNGVARSHIAAFDTATNTLSTTFKPLAGSRVTAITVGVNAVYVGGWFRQVASSAGAALVNRDYFAAFSSSDGSVLPWAPSANASASAMVLAPDASRVIIAGAFTTINGVDAYGSGSVDSSTGTTVLPWALNQRIRDAGPKGALSTLRTDGTQIYGAGWAFGAGASFEGTFGADPLTGNINFVNDCHGDTYDVLPVGQVLYSVSHVHSCEWIGAFKNTNPWTKHYGTAFTTYPTGTNTGPDDYGWDYSGLPSSSVLHFFPLLAQSTFTGQGQAGWSLTGNSDYVAYGGEFPSVNGVAQQGLVRFARTGLAPNKSGPLSTSLVAPSALSIDSGTVRLAWPATWDRDNATLTYNVYRDNATVPFFTTTATSNFWTIPGMHAVDTGLVPGSTHTYKLRAYDPYGNYTGVVSAPVTVSSASLGQYAQDVLNDNASDYWRLGEASGTVSNDYAGFNNLNVGTGVGRGVGGAIGGDTDAASSFDGTSNGVAVSSTPIAGPNEFSSEAWFKTTTTAGGKILGFGDAASGNSNNYDRHFYMDNAGHVIFGVFNNGVNVVQSVKTYNDGIYHQVVGTLSPSTGMTLFVDGNKVGSNGGTTAGQPFTGYWRVGGDNLSGWPNQPASSAFAGTIDDVAIYPAALSLAQVQKHYVDSGRSLNLPTDNFGKTVYNLQPDLFWRLDEGSGTTAIDRSPNGNDGVYSGGYTLGQASPVAGATGTAVAFNGIDGTIGSVNSLNSPSTYTESAWFKTTTNHGGKIIGFGCAQSGNSGCYDRHVYMEDSGQLTFGTWTGQANTITTSATFNDGAWHQVVATQGADGMKLYVDGQLVGTNAQTQAQSYVGFWRVGGDSDWGGTSPFLNGTIDEVAIWNTLVLNSSQVLSLYQASPAVVVVNVAPTASFAVPVCSNLGCAFDGSGSTDPDGNVASYAWNFGDGEGTGSTVSHTFAVAGTYSVSLVVTDNQGATSVAATRSVTVSDLSAMDAFARSIATGWGTSDLGGLWTTASPSSFSVTSGVGVMNMKAGSGQSIYLNAVSSTSTDVQVTITTNKAATGGGIFSTVMARKITGAGEYRAKTRITSTGTVALSLASVSPTGVETTLKAEVVIAGLSYAPGTQLRIRFQAIGTNPTTLRAKVWKVGSTEPATWPVSVTDSTAGLQAAGSVGLYGYLSVSATSTPVDVFWDDFQAGPAA